ncbi:DUF1771-domain-containing protein [Astrocystis sublimbata]|nr:DUF1771-domain-containing protein [Astrocystis sublimbata]
MSGGIELQRYPEQGGFENRHNDHYRERNQHRPRLTEEQFKGFRAEASGLYEESRTCFSEATQAYGRGDGAGAKELSNRGHKLVQDAEKSSLNAGEAIFAIINEGQDPDTIDLHGQYVKEAVIITRNEIQKRQRSQKTYIHVIVGQGHHSKDNKQHLKPAIEELCDDLGLRYETEENAGRIYVTLQGDHKPSPPPQHDGYQQHPQPQYHPDQQQQSYPGQQQQHQQQEQGDEVEKFVKRFLRKILNKFCCNMF